MKLASWTCELGDGVLCDQVPDCYLDLLLQPFQGLYEFTVVLVGVVQLDFHLIQVCLHLLLEPKCLCPALGLRLQAGLQGLDCPLVVLPASPSREGPGILACWSGCAKPP